MPPVAWEYHSLIFETPAVVAHAYGQHNAVTHHLAGMGSHGWELVSVTPIAEPVVLGHATPTAKMLYTFKRPHA